MANFLTRVYMLTSTGPLSFLDHFRNENVKHNL